jgi:hypothetical protein
MRETRQHSQKDWVESLDKLGQGCLTDGVALLPDAVAHTLFQMFVRPPGPGNANYGYIQVTMLDHMIKSGKDLLVSQVTHGSE